MKRHFSILLASAIILFSFSGCGTTPPPKNTFVIGGIGPLTGDASTYGTSVMRGATIATEEINADGGVNGIELQLNFQDDESNAVKAVNAYNTLIDAGMKISLGAVTSGPCIAIAGETQKDGIFMITPSGSQKECVQYDNCFRVCFTDPQQGTASADYIVKNLSAKKIAIIYDKSNDYSVGITNTFEAEAENLGLEIVTKQAFTNQTNTDFSIQLQKASSSGAELIFLPIYAQEAASILTQAQKAGMNIPFFGCDGLDGIFEKLGKDNLSAAEGTMLLTPFAADSKEKTSQSFVKLFKEKYGDTEMPDQFAADGYDAVYTIKAAIEKAGVTSYDISIKDLGDKMKQAMTEITVNGATGAMTWGADGEPVKQAKAVKIVNGAYVALN